MSKSASSENYQPNFYLLNWFVRIILYSIVFAAVFVPSYVAIEHDICGRSKHELFKSRCNKIAEVRNNMGAINRAQQAYYLEQNKFVDSIAEAGLGIPTETYSHHYRIVKPMVPEQDLDRVQDLDRSISPESHLSMRMAIAQCKIKDDSQMCSHLNYLGVVYAFPDKSESGETEITTRATCEMNLDNPLPTTIPTVNNGIVECPVGSETLGE